jgi:hypothetical protein
MADGVQRKMWIGRGGWPSRGWGEEQQHLRAATAASMGGGGGALGNGGRRPPWLGLRRVEAEAGDS